MVPERPEASLKSRIPVSYGDPVLGLTHAALRTQGFWLDGGAMPWAITLLGCSDERSRQVRRSTRVLLSQMGIPKSLGITP